MTTDYTDTTDNPTRNPIRDIRVIRGQTSVAPNPQSAIRRWNQTLRGRGQGGPAPELLGSHVRSIIAALGIAQPRNVLVAYEALEAALQAILGPFAGHCRAVAWRSRVLTVEVDSAAHLAELRTFQAPRLLAALRERLPDRPPERLEWRVASPTKGGREVSPQRHRGHREAD